MRINILMRRIGSFVVDWILIFIIGIMLFFIGPDFKMEYLLYPSIKMFSAYGFFLSLLWFFAAFLFKDCVCRNASIGKKLFGLRVKNEDDSQPSIFALVIRNITMAFLGIEAIVLLANHGIRIGDIIAKTKVVRENR